MSFGSDKANFRIGTCPKAKPHKICVLFLISFYPVKAACLIGKAPAFHNGYSLFKTRKRNPQKQHTVIICNLTYRKGAYVINIHCVVMVFCTSALSLFRINTVLPRRISINNLIFLSHLNHLLPVLKDLYIFCIPHYQGQ